MTTNMAEVDTSCKTDSVRQRRELGYSSVSSSRATEREVRGASARRRISTYGRSSGNRRELDVGPHICTLCWRYETGATGAEQKRVQSLETVGGGKRTEDSGSKIRNVASRVAAGHGGKV